MKKKKKKNRIQYVLHWSTSNKCFIVFNSSSCSFSKSHSLWSLVLKVYYYLFCFFSSSYLWTIKLKRKTETKIATSALTSHLVDEQTKQKRKIFNLLKMKYILYKSLMCERYKTIGMFQLQLHTKKNLLKRKKNIIKIFCFKVSA